MIDKSIINQLKNKHITTKTKYEQIILSKLVAKKIVQYATILLMVNTYYKNDSRKAILWMHLPNPSLGNVTPIEMITKFNQYNKLLKWVKTQLSEN